jgi:hypothetical protein
MKSNTTLGIVVGTAVMAFATAAFAGRVAGPAPLMGAGLPGLVVLATAAGGYLAVRFGRGKRD